MDEYKPLRGGVRARAGAGHQGRVVQVAPIKPILKAPGSMHLKVKYVKLLSSFGFKFNLHHYTKGGGKDLVGQCRLNR